MKFNVEIWFFGRERYGSRGRERDLILKKNLEIEMDPGHLNPPILSIEIDGTERIFRFAADVGNGMFYHESTIVKL